MRTLPLAALTSLMACFGEPPAADDGGGGSTDTDASTTQVGTTADGTTIVATTTSSSADTSGSTHTTTCEPLVIDDVATGHRPVVLTIAVFTGTDVTTFNEIEPGLLDPLLGADSEDLRLVFADEGTATPPVSAENLCGSCEEKTCESALHVPLVGPPHISALLGAAVIGAFDCVIHRQSAEPIGRLLVVLGSAKAVPPLDLNAIEELLDTKQPRARVDLLCNGCSIEGGSELETLIALHGGFVHDLAIADSIPTGLFAAALAPPACAWPIMDDITPPLDLPGLGVIVDLCGPEEPCPVELERVGGPAACDIVPVGPQFYVLSDLFAPGVPGVVLCPHFCEVATNAISSNVRVQHIYACPD